jgi:diguanylate cyclase (GGDEF)-like protein
MTAERVCVDPTSTVHTAVLMMRENHLSLLPVVVDDELVGILHAASLFVYQPDVLVADVMCPPISVSASDGLSSAAAVMRAHGYAEAPVVDGGLVGFLKSADLLNAWDMPVDPLTGLPWQDSFRLRSSMRLAAGHELTVLFFDMDDFGGLNKSHGHVVGDRALKAVAGAIRDALDPTFDQACRFGGDEFVVSTTRPRSEAVAWATGVRAIISNLLVEGMDRRLSVSMGISGGLRQGERPGIHAPSNLDDLINRASQASTLAKASPTHLMSLDTEPLPTAERPQSGPSTDSSRQDHPPRPARIRIRGVQSVSNAGGVRAEVHLERSGQVCAGACESASGDEIAAVALATTNALKQFLPDRYEIRPTDVTELVVGLDERVIMALVRLDGPHGRQNLIGVSDASSNKVRAAVKAVLDAVNRPLEAIAAPLLEG